MTNAKDEAQLRKPRPQFLGTRYAKGTVLIRTVDGTRFTVIEDTGQGIRFKEHPECLFDRSFFKPAK